MISGDFFSVANNLGDSAHLIWNLTAAREYAVYEPTRDIGLSTGPAIRHDPDRAQKAARTLATPNPASPNWSARRITLIAAAAEYSSRCTRLDHSSAIVPLENNRRAEIGCKRVVGLEDTAWRQNFRTRSPRERSRSGEPL